MIKPKQLYILEGCTKMALTENGSHLNWFLPLVYLGHNVAVH